ncbi:hypothetical protein HPB48_020197 [Haemaphysalis longicornis]|uniref:Uncharacterized protein n=1 Tax=Haemaphysalis longicornis TaxID=44386 RepID=A0A9J6FS49_HAELO|nr:hypothetical protein HPB48_020197 [Haemaphysalis longicornis]
MACTKYYVESNGRVLLDAPKRPTLSVIAVPCIFPGCPKYLTRKQKSRKSPRKRQPTTRDRPVALLVVAIQQVRKAKYIRGQQCVKHYSRSGCESKA